MQVAIGGIGVVGPFGSGIDAFSEALSRKKICTENVLGQSCSEQEKLPVYRADTRRLDEFIPKANLRRVDHYARMALLAGSLALRDAGEIEIGPNRLGIVVATGYGASSTTSAFLDSFIKAGDTFSSPTHFSNSVHNAAAAHVSILFKVSGPCLTVSQFELSVASALLTSMRWLEEERVDYVLLGGVDEYCELLGYCWWRLFSDWGTSAVEPFSFGKQSAIPGEGAVFFLLSRPNQTARSYGNIIDVRTGNMKIGPPAISEEGLLIIGADGHKQCGKPYESLLAKSLRTVSFTPIYGSFPTNNAFDMAAGAFVLSGDTGFLPSYTPPGHKFLRGTSIELVHCLKVGAEGDFGMITICRP